MTTGEKLAVLRKKNGMTQEDLAEVLGVSRQSVSRWEMDVAFPETDKLIRLGKLFECSIDFLLNDCDLERRVVFAETSADECCRFIRECGYFFLATSADNQPRLRPLGMIYSNGKELFFTTDKRKSVHSDLVNNPKIELAAYNLHTRKWIRIRGEAEIECSGSIREEFPAAYPILKQKYPNEAGMHLAIYKLLIDDVSIT